MFPFYILVDAHLYTHVHFTFLDFVNKFIQIKRGQIKFLSIGSNKILQVNPLLSLSLSPPIIMAGLVVLPTTKTIFLVDLNYKLVFNRLYFSYRF